MAHHAYVYSGDQKEGIAASLAYAERELGMDPQANPDIAQLSFGLFSVADARRVGEVAMQGSIAGDQKVIILAVARIFHEAQNALLKVFEEPPERTTLILIVPSEGILLPTLRSRLIKLPGVSQKATLVSEEAVAFLNADQGEREKLVAKLLLRTKSDKDEEKQAARLAAVGLLEGITRTAYMARTKKDSEELTLLLRDLDRFAPMLHDRAAPLKLIFEHLLIIIPTTLRAS